jgi:2-deoxy-D-gluconate 3-dehydrogenase
LTKATFADPEKVAGIKSKIKLDRIGEIEDVMGAVLYLATPASAMVTGTSLLIDGGWTAG